MAENSDITTMIADYMEKGFLDNIIDMFKHDKALYQLIGDLIADERIRVRLGISALVETLVQEDYDHSALSIPSLARPLRSTDPTIRGDAAYLLGVIGHHSAIPLLVALQDDENSDVKEIAKEAIEEIYKRQKTAVSGMKNE